MSTHKRRVSRHPTVYCARIRAGNVDGAFWYLVRNPSFGYDIKYSNGLGGYHKWTFRGGLKLLRSLNAGMSVQFGRCTCRNHNKA